MTTDWPEVLDISLLGHWQKVCVPPKLTVFPRCAILLHRDLTPDEPRQENVSFLKRKKSSCVGPVVSS